MINEMLSTQQHPSWLQQHVKLAMSKQRILCNSSVPPGATKLAPCTHGLRFPDPFFCRQSRPVPTTVYSISRPSSDARRLLL